MSFRTVCIAVATSLLTLAAATPALAAPDRTIPLSSTQTTASWQSDPATSVNGWVWWDETAPADSCGGLGVDQLDHCDQTLVHLAGPGSVDVSFPDAGDGISNDWDLYVYEADAEGNPGAELGVSDNVGGAEDFLFDGTAGDYLVIAVPYQAVNSGYTGALSFTPAS